MAHDPLVLAYLAGVVDSDGYITVQRSQHRKYLYYGAKVGIAGTRREPHDLAASLWGGKITCHVPANPGYRIQFQWTRCGEAAASIIEALFPYLRVKREQALVALELQEHVQYGQAEDPFPWCLPDYDPRPHRDELFLEVKSLNLRKPGPRRPPARRPHMGRDA